MIKKTYIERVLIVLNEDGTLKAAHQEKLERVFDGEELYAEKYLPAEPVEEEALIGLLENPALFKQIRDLDEALAEKNEQAQAELQTTIEAANAEIQTTIEAANAEIQKLKDTSAIQIESLSGKVSELEQENINLKETLKLREEAAVAAKAILG